MASTPLQAGSVVGRRYRLERELTRQGGMGVVWTATHLVTKRRVAIKLLRAGGHDDPASRARLLREARASCAVDHPSVLPVLDVIDADGAPALVMELLLGESLRERLEREGALGVRETCGLLEPVARALAAAHAARIVHRDIKPENIFLVGTPGARATVKVLDFGIAKIVATEEPTTNLTESGAMLGTPYYMAPEQAFGERDVGPAADAWALGIVLYECLAGARPTQAENLGQIIKRITQDPLPAVEGRVAEVPAALAGLIGRLLQRDVAARQLDMEEAATILAACADGDADAADADADRMEEAPSALAAPARRVALGGLLALAAAGAFAAAVASRGAAGPHAATPASASSSASGARSGSSAMLPSPLPASAPPSNDGAPVAPASPLPPAAPAASGARSVPAVRDDAGALSRAPPAATAPSAPPATTAPSVPSTTTTATAAVTTTAADDGGTTGPGRVIIKAPF